MSKLLAALVTAALILPIGVVPPNPHFAGSAESDRYSTQGVAPDLYSRWGGVAQPEGMAAPQG